MTALAFATRQAVLDALDTDTRGMVLIDGVSVDHLSFDTRFGTDMTVATARITMSLPRPANVHPNSTVEIQGGHNDFVGVLFSGRLPRWQAQMRRGDTLTLMAAGWSSLLAYRDRFDLVFDGPIALSALFDALCARRNVPSYRADAVTDHTGSVEIMLGANPAIDDGKVTVPASSTPLAYLNNEASQYGYRVYDTADGTVRLSRVSGMPGSAPKVTFAEGVSIFGADGEFDITGIVNYPDIHGRTYEDRYGASIPIRAFPEAVESSPYVPVNNGVSYRPIRSSLITTQQQAEAALAVAQIDGSAPETPVQWDAVAVPGVSVGDVVEVDSETVEASGMYWLIGMAVNGRESGSLTATYEAWRGGGEATPPGDNSTETVIQANPVHMGNETLNHYAVSAPSGISATWTITIPERTTAVAVRGWHHGTNSQVIGGIQTEIEVTRWQVWAPDVPSSKYDDKGTDAPRPITSGYMPSVPEELAQRRNYSIFTVVGDNVTNPGFWTPFAVNLSRLDPGTYVLRLVCGEKAGPDDFEVRRVVLETHGTTEPVLIPQETT